MSAKIRSSRSLLLLRILYASGKSEKLHSMNVKQIELAKQLGISRQALSSHLRRLRRDGYIRTGRGFIDITEKGLAILQISTNPAFLLIKVRQAKRDEILQRLESTNARVFLVKGDIDAFLMVEQDKLDEVLEKLGAIEGIEETKSYVTIKTLT